jgi:tRNA pseudouridine55 synthase
MRRGSLDPSGLVLVDKPAGPSSFAIVRDLRRRTGARAGHAGTLDPFATGLLLVLLGRSTKLAERFVRLDKRYVTDVDLTHRTSTGDPEGEPADEHEPPTPEELDDALAALRGEVELRVPAASAVKIGGERAYRLHRRGEAPEMPIRRSTVHSLELVGYDGRVATLDLTVGSGTYVRSIADELGGHCATLRRTEVGPFDVANADPGRIIPPDEALAAL